MPPARSDPRSKQRYWPDWKVVRAPTETPGRIKHVFKPVGADNEHILAKLCGFTGDQIAELEKKEII